jgi:ankyrin repeat protein
MMKLVKFLLFWILMHGCFQVGQLYGMDTKQICPSVCPEQQLIDAMKSDRPSDAIIRQFFIKPVGLFTGTENINYQDSDGNTPLMIAIQQNRPVLVEKIIRDYEPSLSPKNKDGMTAYTHTHTAQNQALNTLLLDYETNILNQVATEYKNAQSEAQFLELIRHINLMEYPEVAHATYIRRAFRDCKDQLLQTFSIRLGFNLEEKIISLLFSLNSDGFTYFLNEKIFPKIIAHYKQYINCKDKDGYTLLTRTVADAPNVEAAAILLQHGANPNDTIIIENADGTTQPRPLLFHVIKRILGVYDLAENVSLRLIDLLLQYGANVNLQDHEGKTVLMYAISKYGAQEEQIVRMLLNTSSINLDLVDKLGKTALDIVVAGTGYRRDRFNMLFIKKMLGTVKKDTYEFWEDATLALKLLCQRMLDNDQNVKEFSPILTEMIKCNAFIVTCANNPKIEKNYIDCINLLLPILQDQNHIHHTLAYNFVRVITCKMIGISQDKLSELGTVAYETKNIGLFKALYCKLYHSTIPSSGSSGLHLCIAHNFPQGIKFTCENSLNTVIEIPNSAQETPLEHAIRLGHAECIQELLNHGCNPNPPKIKTIIRDGKEQKITAPGNSLVSAGKTCSTAIPLLENAQQTTIESLSHDILRKILPYVPSVGLDTSRAGSIISFTRASKNMLATLSEWNDNRPEVNAWLLSIKGLSDQEKKDILQARLGTREYDLCCTLLREYPRIIIPLSDDENPLLIQLIAHSPLLPFKLFETVIDCMLIVNKKLVKASQKPLEINERTTSNRVTHWKKGGPLTWETSPEDTKPEHKLTFMDIAACRLRHYMFYTHDGRDRSTEIETLQKILNLLRKNGATLNKEIVVYDHEAALYRTLNWLNLVLDRQHMQNLRSLKPWLLEFLLDESHLDINEELNVKQTALSYAVDNVERDYIDIILKHPKLQVNKIDSSNRTALDYFRLDMQHADPLIKIKNIKLFITLLAAKAKTAVQIAVERKDVAFFKHCVEDTAYLNGLVRIVPNPPLLYITKLCIDADFIDGIQTLIDAGHNLNYKDTGKENPKEPALIHALKHTKRDCALLLIDGGADVNCWDTDGNSALYWAIKHGFIDCVQRLLNYGCNPGDADTIALAETYCKPSIELLRNAQKTKISDIPHEILPLIWKNCIKPVKYYNIPIFFKDTLNQVKQLGLTDKISNQIWNSKKTYAAALTANTETKIALLRDAIEKRDLDTFSAVLSTSPDLVNTAYANGDNFLTAFIGASSFNVTNITDTQLNFIKCLITHKINVGQKSSHFLFPIGRSSTALITERNQRANLNALELLIFKAGEAKTPQAQQSIRSILKMLSDAGGRCSEYVTVLQYDDTYFNTVPLVFGPLYNQDLFTVGVLLDDLTCNPNSVGTFMGTSHTPLTLTVTLAQKQDPQKYMDMVQLLLHTPGINIYQKTADNKTVFDFVGNSPEIRKLLKMPAWQPGPPYELPPLYTLFEEDKPARIDPAVNPAPIPAPPAVTQIGQTPAVQPTPGNPNPEPRLGAPDGAPVPGTTPPTINTHYFGKKPIAWLAGLSLCAVTVYGIWKYLSAQEQYDDEVDGQENTESPVITINGIL